MKFLDIKFPDNISIGSSGGPEFSTSIVTMQNKNENRNSNWQQPRFRYQLSSAIKNKTDYEAVKSFFLICKGKESSFRFKDFADYKIENQFLFQVKQDSKQVQIFKTYAFHSFLYQRKITKIVPNTLKIICNSSPVSENDFVIDNNTGLINFTKSLQQGVNVYISCEFDVQTRFDIDFLPISFANSYSISTPEINLIEVFN